MVLLALVAALAGCGPSGAKPALPTSTTSLPDATSVAEGNETERPTSGTLAAPSGAPATVAPPAAASTAAPVTVPRVTTTVVEVPDPADAPPPDLPRSSNAGDRSSPYGPFGPFEVQTLASDAQLRVAAAVDRYVQQAVLEPWRTGAPADLTGVLTASALATLQPDQRAVLTEEGVPVADDAAADQREVTVEGIVAPDGSAVAVATVTLGATGTVDGVATRTTRTGTLTLVLENGDWRIDAFALDVARDAP